MKPKTIRSILRKKTDKWLKSITDETLRREIKDNAIITGGAIASMLLNEDVNDYDVYFTNKQTAKKAAQYYVDKFLAVTKSRFTKDSMYVEDEEEENETSGRIKIVVRSDGVAEEATLAGSDSPSSSDQTQLAEDAMKDKKEAAKGEFRPIYLSANAITLSEDVQLVIRFYGDPETIHENYDFVHATNWWTSKDGWLELQNEALVALMNRDLVYVGSKYPLASMIRIRKFLKRGFTINAGQMLKIAWQISALNMSDVKVLEEQLTGVDVAYFDMLIRELEAKQKADTSFEIDYNYICEIIDRIF